MAAPRYSTRHGRTGQRQHLTLIECGLALCVIVGLGFVSLRIMTMQASPAFTQSADAGTVVPKPDTVPPAPDAADAKTP